ncbi:MAG: Arm DNA-binding domain-containing protein, partial [Pseudomonadota bacterium]
GTGQGPPDGPATQALDQGRQASPKTDGDGLTFTLSAAGVSGWILRYPHRGRRRELTIGRYPDIGLTEARGIATLKRAEVQQGRNPAAEKQKPKARLIDPRGTRASW